MAGVPEKDRELFAVRYKRGYELGLKEGEKNAREIFMEQMGVQVNVVQIPKD
jgi:hypothetical protein